jgi:hypothetical protein
MMGWFWREGAQPNTEALRIRARKLPLWRRAAAVLGTLAFMALLLAIGRPGQALTGIPVLIWFTWLWGSRLRLERRE